MVDTQRPHIHPTNLKTRLRRLRPDLVELVATEDESIVKNDPNTLEERHGQVSPTAQ